MNFKYLVSILILFFINQSFPWGGNGHTLISKKAVEFLPEEMNAFKQWQDYIAEHAEDPDKRRKDDPNEYPKHFIDIDYYKEFHSGNMIYEKNNLVEIYNDSIVTAMGILPWATLETFNNLTRALQDGNRDRALIYAADLGHYVADGHQPMHTMLNYDGQLSGQEGVHGRYESDMVNKFIEQIEASVKSTEAEYIVNPLEFIFGYLGNANSLSPVLLSADIFAFNSAGSRSSDDYYRVLWFRTSYVTKIQFNNSINDFSSLLYTAWINAGRPPFDKIN